MAYSVGDRVEHRALGAGALTELLGLECRIRLDNGWVIRAPLAGLLAPERAEDAGPNESGTDAGGAKEGQTLSNKARRPGKNRARL